MVRQYTIPSNGSTIDNGRTAILFSSLEVESQRIYCKLPEDSALSTATTHLSASTAGATSESRRPASPISRAYDAVARELQKFLTVKHWKDLFFVAHVDDRPKQYKSVSRSPGPCDKLLVWDNNR